MKTKTKRNLEIRQKEKENHLAYRSKKIKITADSSVETMEARREGSE